MSLPPSREAIFTALFALVSGLPQFVLTSRKFRLWDAVPPEQRPCLLQYQGPESNKEGQRQPLAPVRRMTAKFFIYTNVKEVDVPATIMNPLLDAVDNALSPAIPGQVQNLGGLVSSCYIDGETIVVTGDLDGDGIAVIPITILAP
jgi:hypothetical protein